MKRRSHGIADTEGYGVWRMMIRRCTQPNLRSYKNYGGRGIKVCERWLGDNGFKTFLADMWPKPTPEHQIDRIDNDGNYEPGNVRWATRKEQAINMRHTNYILVGGVKRPVRQVYDELNPPMSYWTFNFRTYKAGWPIERAILQPIGKNGPHK